MKILRRILLALLTGLVLLLFFGRPMVWAEATLVMWDIAAGGGGADRGAGRVRATC